MSRGIITADQGSNSYLVRIAGYDWTFPAQSVTLDDLSVGAEVEVVDVDNMPPHKCLQFGKLRILPNVGNYTYSPSRSWSSWETLKDKTPASLAKSFFLSSERNPIWQEKCPLYRRGTVTGIIDAKYMYVRVWNFPSSEGGTSGMIVKCRVDYMSCDTGAFSADDTVVVKFEDTCVEKPVVIGFWDSPGSCEMVFTLMRGDGAYIDENYIVRFYGYDSNGSLQFLYTSSQAAVVRGGDNNNEYTLLREYFLDYALHGITDPNGYWIEYEIVSGDNCINGSVQYPYRYKTADKRQEADLTSSGGEDVIPYWEVSAHTLDLEPDPDGASYADVTDVCDEIGGTFVFGTFNYVGGGTHYVLGSGVSVVRSRSIKTSIPYKVLYRIFENRYTVVYSNEHHIGDACYLGYDCMGWSGVDNIVEVSTGDGAFSGQAVSYGGSQMDAVLEDLESNMTWKEHTMTFTDIFGDSFTDTCYDEAHDPHEYELSVAAVQVGPSLSGGQSGIGQISFSYNY